MIDGWQKKSVARRAPDDPGIYFEGRPFLGGWCKWRACDSHCCPKVRRRGELLERHEVRGYAPVPLSVSLRLGEN